MLDAALVAGADDVIERTDMYEVYTQATAVVNGEGSAYKGGLDGRQLGDHYEADCTVDPGCCHPRKK